MNPPTITPRGLLRQYNEGRLTATGVVVTIMALTSKQRVSRILEALPPDLLDRVKEFVEDWRPGLRVFRGPQPNMKTVKFVRDWFAAAASPSSANNRPTRTMLARRVAR